MWAGDGVLVEGHLRLVVRDRRWHVIESMITFLKSWLSHEVESVIT